MLKHHTHFLVYCEKSHTGHLSLVVSGPAKLHIMTDGYATNTKRIAFVGTDLDRRHDCL